MANVIMVTHWTGGDVFPFIKMGEILKKAGHDLTLFTHCVYEEKAKSKNLNFVAIDNQPEYLEMVRDFPALTDPVHYVQGTAEFQRKHHGLERSLREYQLISEHCQRADTILIFRHRSSTAALLVAEKLKLPAASVFLAPNYIAHLDFHEQLFGNIMKEEMNLIRQAIGLESISSWTGWMLLPQRKIGVWPQWFESDGENNLEGLTRIGFVVEAENGPDELPDELKTMLQCGEGLAKKPVLISGGTSKMINPLFYQVAVGACKLANQKAILAVPFEELVPADLPDNIIRFKSLPVRKLMPYMSAVIHHGGIGTASEAVASGIPQMILPHLADRSDNAHRLRSLGVAKVFPEVQWDPEMLAQGLKDMQAPDFLENCRKLSERYHQDDPAQALREVVDEMSRGQDDINFTPWSAPVVDQAKTEVPPGPERVNHQPLSPEKRRMLLEIMKRKMQ